MDAKGLTSWRRLYAGKALAIWIHIGGTQETRKGSPRLQDEGDSLHGLGTKGNGPLHLWSGRAGIGSRVSNPKRGASAKTCFELSLAEQPRSFK